MECIAFAFFCAALLAVETLPDTSFFAFLAEDFARETDFFTVFFRGAEELFAATRDEGLDSEEEAEEGAPDEAGAGLCAGLDADGCEGMC